LWRSRTSLGRRLCDNEAGAAFADVWSVGGGTPFLPPVTEHIALDLIETRTFGCRVMYERYRRSPRTD
jgi:hypothetical protein